MGQRCVVIPFTVQATGIPACVANPVIPADSRGSASSMSDEADRQALEQDARNQFYN